MAAFTARMRRAVRGLPSSKSLSSIAFFTFAGIFASPPNISLIAFRKEVRTESLSSFWSWPRDLPTLSICGSAATIFRATPSCRDSVAANRATAFPFPAPLALANSTKAANALLYPLTLSAMVMLLCSSGLLKLVSAFFTRQAERSYSRCFRFATFKLTWQVRNNTTSLPNHQTNFGLPDGQKKMVGAAGFGPTTFCAQGRRATRLRYTPIQKMVGRAGLGPATP